VGAERAQVSSALGDLPVSELVNPGFDEGMASSIRGATAWAQSLELGGLILMTVDQPLVNASHLDRLIERFCGHQRRIASDYGLLLGVPALFPSSDFDALLELTGDAEARSLLRDDPETDSIPFAEGALNIDCETDLERAPVGGEAHLPR
jgi:molybdenum cofactor cytidylyltransferase